MRLPNVALFFRGSRGTIFSDGLHCCPVDATAERRLRLQATRTSQTSLNSAIDIDHAHAAASSDTDEANPPEDNEVSKVHTLEKRSVEPTVEDLDDVPDGGWRAWLCTLGAFCGLTATFGVSNGTGTIQNYIATEILTNCSDSKIGWIFSLWLFFMYVGSVQTGPVYDAYGPSVLLLPGCVGWTLSLFMLSLCSEYYQFILAFSVLGGISTSMIFNPSVTALGQWFNKRLSLATGVAFLGGSAGGVYVPLMLDHLFPRIGYGWSIRVLAFIVLGLCAVTCLTVRCRTTRDDVDWHEALPDLKSLKNLDFAACSFGTFLIEWGFFVPVIYMVSYAKSQGLSSGYSGALMAYLNVGSSVGRLIPGYLAGKVGSYNVVVVSCLLAGVLALCIWIPAGTTKAGLTTFVVLFGLGSGASVSVTPNCIVSISSGKDYGKRYGTAYSMASIAVLTGAPIAGTMTGNNYLGVQLFSGCSYIAAGLAFLLARWKAAGWQKYF